jgi:porphobilinogen synthase
MVKPALPYIDILWRVRERFGKPTAVYHVSGEYAMVKAAVEKGIVEESAAVLEIMTALKRAGADIIVTYWARELAEWIRTVNRRPGESDRHGDPESAVLAGALRVRR